MSLLCSWISSGLVSKIRPHAWRTLHDCRSSEHWSKIQSPIFILFQQRAINTQQGQCSAFHWKNIFDCWWNLPEDSSKSGMLTKYFVITAETSIPFQMHLKTSIRSKPCSSCPKRSQQAEWGLCGGVTTKTVPSCPLCGGDTTAGHQDKAAVKR